MQTGRRQGPELRWPRRLDVVSSTIVVLLITLTKSDGDSTRRLPLSAKGVDGANPLVLASESHSSRMSEVGCRMWVGKLELRNKFLTKESFGDDRISILWSGAV